MYFFLLVNCIIHGWGELRPTKTKPPLRGFFIARRVRAFSRLEHRVRKEQIELTIAVIVLITAIVKLITKLL